MAFEQPIATSTIVSQSFRVLMLAGVSSFGDDGEQAQDAAEQYPQALRACLEHADWHFASELVSLPEASPGADEATDPDLPHAYALPGDVVALRRVGGICTHWRRDRRFLRADAPGPITVRYTAAITDETQLPGTFQEAVALKLAALLAPRWVTDRGRQKDIEDKLELALAKAARQDARQASAERWDGRPEAIDWADEARL